MYSNTFHFVVTAVLVDILSGSVIFEKLLLSIYIVADCRELPIDGGAKGLLDSLEGCIVLVKMPPSYKISLEKLSLLEWNITFRR